MISVASRLFLKWIPSKKPTTSDKESVPKVLGLHLKCIDPALGVRAHNEECVLFAHSKSIRALPEMPGLYLGLRCHQVRALSGDKGDKVVTCWMVNNFLTA